MVSGFCFLVSGFLSFASAVPPPETRPLPPVLTEIDRTIRARFWDPKLKGVDWSGAVAKAAEELSATAAPSRKAAFASSRRPRRSRACPRRR